jgi:hypothetical protein
LSFSFRLKLRRLEEELTDRGVKLPALAPVPARAPVSVSGSGSEEHVDGDNNRWHVEGGKNGTSCDNNRWAAKTGSGACIDFEAKNL